MSVQGLQTAAVLTDAGPSPKFTLSQIPIPTPGPNELLVRLSCTSVCGSDAGMAHGHFGPVNSILGHEGVGRVVAAGSNAAYLTGCASTESIVGRRIVICLLRDVCGSCNFCLAPAELAPEPRCAAHIFSGQGMDGTFAQYAVARARYAQLLPASLDEVPDELVAPVLCGGVTAYKALKVSGVPAGAWAVVSGAGGGVGALGVAYARAMGYRVVGVDIGESKRDYVLSQGAETYINAAGVDDAGAEVKRATDGAGAAVVLVAVGSPAAYQAAMGMLAAFGTLVCVGIPPPGGVVNFSPLDVLTFGYKIVGSVTGTRIDVVEALEFVKRGLVVPKVKWAQLGEIERIIAELGRGEGEGKYVIDLKEVAGASPIE